MRHLSCHANGLRRRRMRVNGFADSCRISADFSRQRNCANYVADMRAKDDPVEDVSSATVSLIVRFYFSCC